MEYAIATRVTFAFVFSLAGPPQSSRTWTPPPPPAAESTRRAADSTAAAATSAWRSSSTRGACSTYSGCAFRGVRQHLLWGKLSAETAKKKWVLGCVSSTRHQMGSRSLDGQNLTTSVQIHTIKYNLLQN